jgi:RHS repeat-associated protein
LTGNSNGQTYAWDIENRLTTATQGANTLGAYTYDALGRRVSKTVGANTTVFISDGLQKICEYENGTLARAYAYGTYIDEPLVMISGVNKYYYHSNNLYSVAALTDAAGAVIERYKYDPYGKATILAPDGTTIRTASLVNNPFMYDGYYHDTETGLEFVNARYYSSDLGRFIARDPIGYEGGINLYRYCSDNPANSTDPLGLRDETYEERQVLTYLEELAKDAEKKGMKNLASNIRKVIEDIKKKIKDSPSEENDPMRLKVGLLALKEWSYQSRTGIAQFRQQGKAVCPKYSTPCDAGKAGGFKYKCNYFVTYVWVTATGHRPPGSGLFGNSPPAASKWGDPVNIADPTKNEVPGKGSGLLGDVVHFPLDGGAHHHVGICLGNGVYVSAREHKPDFGNVIPEGGKLPLNPPDGLQIKEEGGEHDYITPPEKCTSKPTLENHDPRYPVVDLLPMND